MPITFAVSRVERATVPVRMPPRGATPSLQSRPVEAMGANAPVFLPPVGHGLIRAVHTAYGLHYPLVLTPDAIWLAIAHGFASHVNANAERLRGKFVRHAGKARITIRRDDFVKGSPENPWPQTFGAFSDAIAEHIGRQRNLVVCDFTTTGPCERAASEVVLLDAMKTYFDYSVLTLCGIPEITLEGTAEDWRSIYRRARGLEEYELAWWTDALGPVLDELVATAEGRVDLPFWRTLFKHETGSGGPWISGWINVLFPYLRRGPSCALVRNERMGSWKDLDGRRGRIGELTEIPSGLSCVPFTWDYLGHDFAMEFLGGFMGVVQDDRTLAVRPAIGWAVRDAECAPPMEIGMEGLARCPLATEATVIAGRLTDPIVLTAGEAATLCSTVARHGEASGTRLACVPAGDLQNVDQFPECPVTLRFVVGVRVAAVSRGGRRRFDIAELRGALDKAREMSEADWRAISEMLPSELRGAAALYLTISGDRESVSLRFSDGRVRSVAEVTTAGDAVAEVDMFPIAQGARMEAVHDSGAAKGVAVMFWHLDGALW